MQLTFIAEATRLFISDYETSAQRRNNYPEGARVPNSTDNILANKHICFFILLMF